MVGSDSPVVANGCKSLPVKQRYLANSCGHWQPRAGVVSLARSYRTIRPYPQT